MEKEKHKDEEEEYTKINCRMYEKKFPEVHDLVMVYTI